jgi:hypothetical protein
MREPSKIAVLTACTLLWAPTLASAATVSGASGAVFVNAGKGFVPLAGAAEFAPGAQVMVKPGGYAQLAYAGNCTVKVGSGLWTVQPGVPCANGTTEIDLTGRMNQATAPMVTSNEGTAVVTALIGVAVAGVIACIAMCDKIIKPASP